MQISCTVWMQTGTAPLLFLSLRRSPGTPRNGGGITHDAADRGKEGRSLNDFYAYISRLRLIRRWSLMRNTQPENDAEHFLQVAMIAHALAILARDRSGRDIDPEAYSLKTGTRTLQQPKTYSIGLSTSF